MASGICTLLVPVALVLILATPAPSSAASRAASARPTWTCPADLPVAGDGTQISDTLEAEILSNGEIHHRQGAPGPSVPALSAATRTQTCPNRPSLPADVLIQQLADEHPPFFDDIPHFDTFSDFMDITQTATDPPMFDLHPLEIPGFEPIWDEFIRYLDHAPEAFVDSPRIHFTNSLTPPESVNWYEDCTAGKLNAPAYFEEEYPNHRFVEKPQRQIRAVPLEIMCEQNGTIPSEYFRSREMKKKLWGERKTMPKFFIGKTPRLSGHPAGPYTQRLHQVLGDFFNVTDDLREHLAGGLDPSFLSSKAYKQSLNTPRLSGAFIYPPHSVKEWHTDYYGWGGWRAYVIRTDGPGRSIFNVRHPMTGEIVTRSDPDDRSTFPGVVRIFHLNSPGDSFGAGPLWHCVHSNMMRYAIGLHLAPEHIFYNLFGNRQPAVPKQPGNLRPKAEHRQQQGKNGRQQQQQQQKQQHQPRRPNDNIGTAQPHGRGPSPSVGSSHSGGATASAAGPSAAGLAGQVRAAAAAPAAVPEPATGP